MMHRWLMKKKNSLGAVRTTKVIAHAGKTWGIGDAKGIWRFKRDLAAVWRRVQAKQTKSPYVYKLRTNKVQEHEVATAAGFESKVPWQFEFNATDSDEDADDDTDREEDDFTDDIAALVGDGAEEDDNAAAAADDEDGEDDENDDDDDGEETPASKKRRVERK